LAIAADHDFVAASDGKNGGASEIRHVCE
jgi:hypothetical protein